MQVKKRKGLNEATLDAETAKAAASIGANADTTVTEDELEEEGQDAISLALDAALATADEQKMAGTGHYTNVLLQGLAGTAKTSIVRAWAKRNNINLFIVNTSTLDETDLTGVVATNADKTATVKLKTKMFDALERPDSVLFLDEFNRGRSSVRGTLLTLVNDHLIDTGTEQDTGSGEAGKMELKNFLFTIAAINPARSGSQYQTDELDPAEVGRFARVNVAANKRTTLSYLIREFGAMAEKGLEQREDESLSPRQKKAAENLVKNSVGRIEIAKALLKDPDFQFDNEQDERKGYDKYGVDFTGLSPRSLTNCLAACNGTKEDFLKKFPMFCSEYKLPMIKKIMAKYRDSDKKANDVFKKRDKGVLGNINAFLAS